MYNGCLKNLILPERWKKDEIKPIMKAGTQTCEGVTKYRHMSLLIVGGKTLEKALKKKQIITCVQRSFSTRTSMDSFRKRSKQTRLWF